ncbi:MAG: Uma2 family endonuclease [Acidobacteriota bacterium]|nr:Uma2 family endonuclease [Acidobacteriota bacterium]
MQAVAEVALDPEQSAEIALDPERSYEIINGKPEEKEMPGARHSGIAGRLAIELGIYLRGNKIGELYPEASFQIGANECIPDLAFISSERLPIEGEPATKWPFSPDLAVEVVSPSDYYEKVNTKALSYLTAGVKQVWIVSPESQTITVYRSPTNIIAFPPESELTCEDLFPGFRCSLSEIFKNPAQSAN